MKPKMCEKEKFLEKHPRDLQLCYSVCGSNTSYIGSHKSLLETQNLESCFRPTESESAF